jgi:hypothetical protein
MLLIYLIILTILLFILLLLKIEEKRFNKSITQGVPNKYWIFKEKRRFIRFPEKINVRYTLFKKNPDYHNSKTANISRTGLCLVSYKKVKEKDCLDMEMDLPGFSKPVKLAGRVSWIKDLKARDEEGRRLFYVGVRFLKMPPDTEAVLAVYLNSLRKV